VVALAPVERECGDEQRDREADPGDRAAPGDGHPAHRGPQPSTAQPRHKPRAAEDADGLPDHVTEQDPERDRRRESSREESAVDRNPRVREREQRHDDVARPGVKELLQPLVERRRRPELHSGRACQSRRGLLAKLSEPFARAFEIGPRSREGVDQEAHREADHDRLDARSEQGHPGGSP
jgi:hypothetical protein